MNWEKFYDKAYNWVLSFGPRLLVAIIVLVVGMWLIKLFKKWATHHMTKNEFDPSLKPFFVSLANTILQVLLLLSLMQILGLQLTVFTTVIGAVGVAAGLALSGTLQNFTSGVLILLLKPFQVGDIIIAQGQEGIVNSIQIFYTVVTTYNNSTVIIPNSKLSNEVIINLSRQGKRRLDIELKFPFAISFEEVSKVINNSINADTDLLHEPPSRIGVSSVDPDGYKVMINVWTAAHSFENTKLFFQEKLIEDLKAAGIKLPGM